MDCVFLGVTLALLSPRVSPVWFLLDLPCSLQKLVVSEPAVSLLEGLLSAPHRNRNLEVCDALRHLGHAEGVGFVRVCRVPADHAGWRGRAGRFRFMELPFPWFPHLVH